MKSSAAQATQIILSEHTDSYPPESVLQIIREACTDQTSPVNDRNHPWHRESVKALHRLQLGLMNPAKPPVSELDLRRIHISAAKVREIQMNQDRCGSAIGNRPKLLTVFVGWNPKNGKPIYTQKTVEEWEAMVADSGDEPLESDVEECEECGENWDECDCDFDNDNDW